jgi:hypothetical protein
MAAFVVVPLVAGWLTGEGYWRDRVIGLLFIVDVRRRRVRIATRRLALPKMRQAIPWFFRPLSPLRARLMVERLIGLKFRRRGFQVSDNATQYKRAPLLE